MASLNESLYSSPRAKRALKLQAQRIDLAENLRKSAGRPGMSYEQKLATAVTLQNTAEHLRLHESINYGGATQPSGIGQ